MVSYLKNNSDYGYYIIQSDSTNNDDWITDHSGDPGELDLDLFTRDSEYIYIKKYNRSQDVESYAWMMEPFPDGEGFKMTVGVETGGYTVAGIVESDAEMEGIKDFCKRCNRDDAKDIYLVHRRSATDYEKFYEPDFTEVKYAMGLIKRRSLIWQKIDASVHFINLTFWIVWET